MSASAPALDLEKLLTIPQVVESLAKRAGLRPVTEWTVREWIRRGRLKAVATAGNKDHPRRIRVRPEDVEALAATLVFDVQPRPAAKGGA